VERHLAEHGKAVREQVVAEAAFEQQRRE